MCAQNKLYLACLIIVTLLHFELSDERDQERATRLNFIVKSINNETKSLIMYDEPAFQPKCSTGWSDRLLGLVTWQAYWSSYKLSRKRMGHCF